MYIEFVSSENDETKQKHVSVVSVCVCGRYFVKLGRVGVQQERERKKTSETTIVVPCSILPFPLQAVMPSPPPSPRNTPLWHLTLHYDSPKRRLLYLKSCVSE